jgi:hypothetical protein
MLLNLVQCSYSVLDTDSMDILVPKVWCNRRNTYTEWHSLPLLKGRSHFLNMYMSSERTKYLVIDLNEILS